MGPWETSRRLRASGLACCALLAPGLAAAAPPPALAFARDGEPFASHDLDWIRQLSPETVRVLEPYEQVAVSFRAVPFERVLDAVYGPGWRARQEILFRCLDGYQPTVPVRRVLEHRAWLAFDRADAEGFWIWKRESGRRQRIEVAPYYLVWENLDDADVRLEGDYGWPYQLVGIDLIDARDRFPKMAPPPGASAQVLAGFEAFRVHCSRCHAVNGEGGSIGPELNGARRPTQLRGRAYLRRWIDDPSQIDPTSRMPRLNPDLPDRAQTIDAILAYLDAMARAREGSGAGRDE